MITCPNCGAGNKPGSSTCRMCAASLEGAAGTQAALAQHQSPVQENHGQQEAKAKVEQEGIACPECGTMNEPGWSFCQQCGKRLIKPAASPPQQPAESAGHGDLRTIPEQRAVIDPALQGLKTNPEPQPAEQSYKTVVAQPPVERQPTVEDRFEEPSPPPLHQPKAAPPTVVAPPSARPSKPDIPPQIPLEPDLKPTAPTPPLKETPAAAVPPGPSREAGVEQAGSASGILCTQCGQSNGIGSAFCASCGAPLTFGKTMVISSQAAPPKGQLHLVMEGGQPGEVYDIGDETVIGRTNGAITFPHDGFMSGRHARIERRGSSFVLGDEGSRNGTFIKLREEVELQPGDMILVGKQLFRFEVEK
ncbi:MAG TPA: zinc-ribbon domain-containing protein [Blastocatellia bacterium]|nr:zinc-ribbon domain-containing protein [Blastocatellia bacterium]